MSSSLVNVLLWTAALGSGLMAGVYFAFSAFIMKAFDKIETAQSIAAMNAINDAILRSLFMPVFFGSSIISAILIIVAIIQWGEADSGLILIAGLSYFLGMFICTVVFNVPLNKLLAEVNRDTTGAQKVWSQYLKNWTKWNHLRTVSSMISCVLSIWLLSVQPL